MSSIIGSPFTAHHAWENVSLSESPNPRRSLLQVILLVFAMTGMPGKNNFAQTAEARQQIPEKEKLSLLLKSEPIESLAADARAKGDAVRGSILFAQQNTNCIKCHSSGQQNLLGPDLTRMEQGVTDVYLIESLLEPSKVIKKGFESVTVLLLDGRNIAGRIIEQDPDRIVLRDAGDSGQLVTLERNELDEIAPGKLSSMTEGLIDELRDRQQFLDLAMYIMVLADAGPMPSVNQAPTAVYHNEILSDEIRGLVLIDKLNCAACHESNLKSNPFPHKQAPNLVWGSGRMDPGYIARFIADPAHVQPASSMPDVLYGIEPAKRDIVVNALTNYLSSLGSAEFSPQAIDPLAAERGRELFQTVGCVACHSPRSDDGIEQLAATSVPLGDMKGKYNIAGLAAFLEDPLAARPSGRMPNMVLSHWDSVDIANFLLRNPGGTKTEPFNFDRSLVAEGKNQFQKLGCVNCHGQSSGIVRESNDEKAIPALVHARPDRGCLSKVAGHWPRFQLDDAQRDLIRVALARKPVELSTPDKIVMTLETFNCLVCHQRGNLGGIPPERIQYFQTTNENIGPQSRIPPTLTGVGGKLNSKWLRDVLVTGRAIRPYVQTRMPQYGADNVGHLVPLFEEADKSAEVSFAEFTDLEEMKKAGHQMAGNGGLNCVACHTFQQIQGETMPAVDLTNMAERLHKEWFYTYMRDPQRHSPNTVMPSFWPGGRAMRKDILDGDASLQIEALWQYLLEDRQARTPDGLINEPIELLATDQAVMLRRSFNGIGKRGIGVGYPGEVNLAFDAEQLRLAMIWKGKFADTSGVWKGQGSGNVRPLGNDLIRFDGGPDLDDATDPWIFDLPVEIEKLEQPIAQDIRIRPPHHQFKGYFLDDFQRPTFLYRFDNVDVEDYPVDVRDEQSDEGMIRRTVTFTSENGRPNTTFRAATGETITAGPEGFFLIGKKLKVRIVNQDNDAQFQAEIQDAPSGKQLLVPINVPPGKSTLILEYRW